MTGVEEHRPAITCPCTDDRGVIIWRLLFTCDECPIDKRAARDEKSPT